jgi:hypothetical protein
VTTYPIVALNDGDVLDPAWIDDITDSANDHETRIGVLESPTWIDYTLVWSASTTNPTVVTTNLKSRYQYVTSKQVAVQVRIDLTTGASKGSGSYTFNLPVAAVNSTGNGATGQWIMNDSASAVRMGQAIIETTSTTLKLFRASDGLQLASTNIAGTFTTSWLQFSIQYEVA